MKSRLTSYSGKCFILHQTIINNRITQKLINETGRKMDNTNLTNKILFTILIVLLIGFGFLAPIIWGVVAIIGLILSILFVKSVISFFSRNDVQWLLIGSLSALIIWSSTKSDMLILLGILAFISSIKLVNYYDNIVLTRKIKMLKNPEGDTKNNTSD